MNQMEKFLVCFGCNGHDYMTSVSALSLGGAEHIILDMGICGKHAYSVSYSDAFDAEAIKTDTFVSMALSATTVSLAEAREIIEAYNSIIRSQDAKENRIAELTSQINLMENELANLRSDSGIPF